MLVTLTCPNCRGPLEEALNGVRCSACGTGFPRVHGVISFLGASERFNEGGYDAYQKANWTASARLRDRISKNQFLSLLNRVRIRCSMSGRRDRIFADLMQARGDQSVILDVGCGGGRHYFCRYGKVVGIDPELKLLGAAREIYSEVYHGGGGALPFADESFDYVVSSDVIGHIREGDKDRLFREMFRVLKKGGRTIHVIETDATNRWFRLAHEHPELFEKHFVDRPGHFGLELPSQLRQRFVRHGFQEVAFRKLGGDVPEIGFFAGFFDNEYRERCPGLRWRVVLDRWLARNLVVRELLNIALEPFARLNDRKTPLDHACGALVAFEKPR